VASPARHCERGYVDQRRRFSDRDEREAQARLLPDPWRRRNGDLPVRLPLGLAAAKGQSSSTAALDGQVPAEDLRRVSELAKWGTARTPRASESWTSSKTNASKAEPSRRSWCRSDRSSDRGGIAAIHTPSSSGVFPEHWPAERITAADSRLRLGPSPDSVLTSHGRSARRRARLERAVDAQSTEQVQLADAVAKRAPARVFRVGFTADTAAVGAQNQLLGLSHQPRLGGRLRFKASPGRS
jgi:hypothetical protein